MKKRDRLKQLGLLGKLISDPVRIEILDLLAQAPRTVEQVAETTGFPIANASHHLRRLKAQGLIFDQQEGKYRRYRFMAPEILFHLESLYFSMLNLNPDSDPGLWIFPSHLRNLKHTTMSLLDIRPEVEFNAGHMLGAIHCEPRDIQSLPNRIASDRMVLAYCRGPWCDYAGEAVTLLRAHGFEAYRLASSAPTHSFWQAP